MVFYPGDLLFAAPSHLPVSGDSFDFHSLRKGAADFRWVEAGNVAELPSGA